MKRIFLIFFISFAIVFFSHSYTFSEPASEPATREDIKLLTQELKEDIKALREEMRALNEQTNKRIDDLRETMFWLFGTFIGIALVLTGFVIRNLWVLGGRVKGIEQTLET